MKKIQFIDTRQAKVYIDRNVSFILPEGGPLKV
jgi:hypothetical protein